MSVYVLSFDQAGESENTFNFAWSKLVCLDGFLNLAGIATHKIKGIINPSDDTV